MKSILFLITGLKRGGAESQLLLLYRELLRKKYTVSLVIIGSTIEYNLDNNFHYYHIKPKSKYFKKLSKLISLVEIIKKEKPDVIKGFLGSGITWLILLSWLNLSRKKIKYLACLRIRLGDFTKFNFLGTYFKYKILGRKLSYITINHYPSKSRLNKAPFYFAKSKTHYIPNGINLDGVNKKYPNNVTSFITPGTIQERKNQDILIKSLLTIGKNDRKGLLFYARGAVVDEAYFRSMENSIQYNKLGDYIRFLPKSTKLDELYLDYDALILPSFHEGFPNVLLEGMKYGKVIIISRQAESNDIIKNGINGFLFDANDPCSLKDAIIRELSAKQIKRMCTINTTLIQEKLSIEKVVNRWEQLYN